MFRVSSPKARSCKGENTHYIDERQNITAQSADFHWGKWCVTSLFCRPSGSSTAQPSPQRATTCQGKGEEAEERELICSCVNTFCQRPGPLLGACVIQNEGEEKHADGTHDLRDWKASGTLHTVHIVIFWTPCGLFLRGQHNLVSSVDAAYHGCSQRILCEGSAHGGTQGWVFPFQEKVSGLPGHVALYLCVLVKPSRRAVCTLLILFILNKYILQLLCCGDCFCWIEKKWGVLA